MEFLLNNPGWLAFVIVVVALVVGVIIIATNQHGHGHQDHDAAALNIRGQLINQNQQRNAGLIGGALQAAGLPIQGEDRSHESNGFVMTVTPDGSTHFQRTRSRSGTFDLVEQLQVRPYLAPEVVRPELVRPEVIQNQPQNWIPNDHQANQALQLLLLQLLQQQNNNQGAPPVVPAPNRINLIAPQGPPATPGAYWVFSLGGGQFVWRFSDPNGQPNQGVPDIQIPQGTLNPPLAPQGLQGNWHIQYLAPPQVQFAGQYWVWA